MSFYTVHARLLILGATVLTGRAATLHSADRVEDHAIIDSHGRMMRRQPDAPIVESSSLGEEMRKVEQLRKYFKAHTSSKAASASAFESSAKGDDSPWVTDRYVLIGDNLCSGGGVWRRYEMNSVTPGQYSLCSAACDSKDECLGFDVGSTGCNLYTQKAVAIGTWAGVQFLNDQAFKGQGDHDKYPQSSADLQLGTSALGANEKYKCYKKTQTKPADSYYWLVGDGTCSGGGAWKRYKKTPASYDECENACNLRDECIGFDVGKWLVGESQLQVNKSTFTTKKNSETGCFLYTQKAVYGTWPDVEVDSPEKGDNDHDDWAPTPYDLSVGHDIPGHNEGKETKCYGKTHWVSLDAYYMEIGQALCDGGGKWKHYKFTSDDVHKCQTKCDEKDACIGLDFQGSECRLYANAAVTSDWHEVQKDGDKAFAGEKEHNHYAPTPFSLSPTTMGASDATKHCYAKTHFQSIHQGSAETKKDGQEEDKKAD